MPEVFSFSETTKSKSAPQPTKLLYDRKSAAYVLSISVRALDYLISGKKLNTIKLGKKIMLGHGELVKFCRSNHLNLTQHDTEALVM